MSDTYQGSDLGSGIKKVFEIWDEHRAANEGGRVIHFQHLNLILCGCYFVLMFCVVSLV